MRRQFVTAWTAVAVLVSACSHGVAGSSNRTAAARAAHPVRAVALSGSELRYGKSVSRTSGVVYQPDVVVLDHGADAVRAVSGNGLSWTLDENAPGVRDIAVGKILVATSFATGRVLHLARHASAVDVLLGPVSLTDVIRDANIRSASPVSIAHPLYYATPSAPGSETTDAAPADAPDAARERPLTTPLSVPSVPVPSPPTPATPSTPNVQVAMPAPTTAPETVTTGEARSRPFLNSAGLGAELFIQHGDGRFDAQVALSLERPTADFVLDIANGTVREASVHLHGAGALTIDVTAAQLSGQGAFAHKRVQIPLSLVIPLGGPAPLYLSITQGFLVTSQIIGKGSVESHGKYKLIGDLYFGIRNGRPLLSATTMAVVDPMNHHTKAFGVAANTVELGWRVTAEVGVGLLGFSAGAWYKLGFTTAFTADVGLDVLHAACVTNSIILRGQFGIGYHVPEVVMKAVNFFLGVFGVKKIPASGGLMSKYLPLWQPAPAHYCP